MGSTPSVHYAVHIGGSAQGNVVVGNGNHVVSGDDRPAVTSPEAQDLEAPDVTGQAPQPDPPVSAPITAHGARSVAAHTIHTAITGDHNTVSH
ncbi:hypothetical protein ACGFI3_46145 [Nonomuraea wenchangensis]|uniref:hypothetical protein n=1 Tax=Nonomuraea wenchangensis TaxID=568860 RepID=UPI0037131E3C